MRHSEDSGDVLRSVCFLLFCVNIHAAASGRLSSPSRGPPRRTWHEGSHPRGATSHQASSLAPAGTGTPPWASLPSGTCSLLVRWRSLSLPSGTLVPPSSPRGGGAQATQEEGSGVGAGPSARAGRSATHHGARPAAGLAEQPVDADHAVGPRGGADVDHGVSGGHRVEPGGPEPFGRGGARPAPAPATRGFAR